VPLFDMRANMSNNNAVRFKAYQKLKLWVSLYPISN
jgi:hypothetical protein